MKKISVIFLAVLLILSLTACKGNSEETTVSQTETTASQSEREEKTENTTDKADSKTLVVYFSVTGTTKGVAEKIAKITNADIYEIKPAKEYTDADIDWNDNSSRTTKEQNDKSARPEISSDKLSLDGYETIYIGYPIWWGEEPRIMDTFVESYNFDGITMIPFCTSGSSSIGNSGKNLEDNAKSGKWLKGERFGAGAQEDEIETWINSL